jgi:large subunit ribosomal protein L7/L12
MSEKFEKIISEVEKLSVLELSELVKALEEKFGVSAAAAVASGGGAPAAASAEEKTAWNVVLKSGGEQKINVIKIVKEATGLGLKEAKDLVDGAPKPVKEGMKKEEAEELKKKLELVGAVVELQ